VDDFTRSFEENAVTDSSGHVTANVPAAALAQGTGSRWLHVTAGESYPLAEQIVALP
jgi:hypothetical protein